LADGGSFVCGEVSGHLATNAELINRFDGARIAVAASGKRQHRVNVA
jgi:RNA 3'-terminal phosphate cyclase